MQQHTLTQDQIAILDFWHKIEFFLPYDLQEALSKIKKEKQIYQPFHSHQVETLPLKQLWSNPYQEKGDSVVGFELFIGVYNKDELSAQLKELLDVDDSSDNVRFIGNVRNSLQSVDGKGLSCCARISLDEFGRLDPYKSGNIEVSTAPWAIGQIRKYDGELSCLDFDKFDSEMRLLKDNLAEFLRTNIALQVTEENPFPPLNGENVAKLVDVVMRRMNFQTDIDTLPLFYLYSKKGKVRKDNNSSDIPPFTVEVEHIQISILNSFFATDIAKVIQVGKQQGEVSSPLLSYLSKEYKRIDLYNSLAGKECIIENLKPEYINRGHWFSENTHHMSLMQQFAINTIFKEVDKKQQSQSLFSVNGPPGTGKTTLLRDIFAENIVRRASALAEYSSVKNTFKTEKIKVNFGKATFHLSILKNNLTGYEMVVTSSNNAAVQNISEELPQVKSLGKNWQDEAQQPKITYLQTVARNVIACKKEKKQKKYIELEPQQSPWGLIACILGRKDKREFFIDQFINKPDEEIEKAKPNYYESILSWGEKYSNLSFDEAKKQFLEKKNAVNQHIEKLTRYMQSVLDWYELEKCNFGQDIQLAQIGIGRTASELETLKQERELIELRKPNYLITLFCPQKNKTYLEEIEGNNRAQATQRELKLNFESSLLQAQKNQEEKQHLLKELSKLREELHCSDIFKESKVKTPTNLLENLEQDQWQISGFWSDENLNQKRAELFQAALVLHEAWIAESMNYGFKANIWAISNLISGKQLQGEQHKVEEAASVIWQSLFMMVPVASTTFASFGFLFRYLGTKSLGWIFVDEAGQAIPQAAVGALWRAKNAIVVGDPLQIEPVFTTPEKLTDLLLNASKVKADFEVSPHKTSVQVLADKANPYGANLDLDEEEKETWIGSPLRVHRRCLEPMFSISNHIAYQGKMVFGLNNTLPDKDPWLMENSAWIHLAEGEKQEEKEVELVTHIFRQLCLQRYKDKQLPPIYIISPFKGVCENIRLNLRKNKKLWNEFGVSSSDWVQKNVGTVHTFQGKESSIVLLVLGRNGTDIGKAVPLVTKPNLLNVAVTRAKDYFFIIGDYHIWKEKYECFKKASPLLNNVIDAERFLKELEQRVKQNR